jgi:hypothetical protein
MINTMDQVTLCELISVVLSKEVPRLDVYRYLVGLFIFISIERKLYSMQAC